MSTMTVSQVAQNTSVKLNKSNDSDQNQLNRYFAKRFSTWILYIMVGILPLIIGFGVAGYVALVGFFPHLFPESAVSNIASIEQTLQKLSTDGKFPNYITQAIPFFFLFITLEILAGVVTGKSLYRLNDSINSIFMGSIQQMLGVFIKSLAIFPYAYIHYNYRIFKFDESEITVTNPLWWIMFIFIDFGYYWFHRFAHEWNALWAAHVVHHNSEEYNLSTALRQGALQPFTSWCWTLFGAPFFPVELLVVHSQINTLYQFWIHTRVIKKLPLGLEWILNTPSHHRVHHGRNPQYCDKNYGGTLIIFDKIFGTFEPEDQEVMYGITHEVGTWNPLYCQLHHWQEIWQTFLKTEGFFNKLRVWIDRGPVFNYYVEHPDVFQEEPVKFDQYSYKLAEVPLAKLSRSKYDSSMPNVMMSLYGFLNSSLLILITTLCLENNEAPQWQRAMDMLLTLFGMFTVSALFDNKPYAKILESFRLVLFLVYQFLMLMNLHHMDAKQTVEYVLNSPALLVCAGFLVGSLVVLQICYTTNMKKLKHA